ncbi:MAG: SIS domain-containing protein [Candidatus Brocadiia bacterium]
MHGKYDSHFSEHLKAVAALAGNSQIAKVLASSAILAARCLKSGGRVFFCGNGGSAADSQHFAAELTIRLERNRSPLAGIALTTDTSAITACGNDFSFDEIFARQLTALGRKGDFLVALSTSGNSRNVLRAIEVARTAGIDVLGLVGESGGAMSSLCDFLVKAPSARTMRVQECHTLLLHCWCDMVEEAVSGN